jgi:hypothetical protein
MERSKGMVVAAVDGKSELWAMGSVKDETGEMSWHV